MCVYTYVYSLYLDILWSFNLPTRWCDFQTIKQPNTFKNLWSNWIERYNIKVDLVHSKKTKNDPPNGFSSSDTWGFLT